MSGFKDDIVSILKQNVLYHGEAMGWIVDKGIPSMKVNELLFHLLSKGFPVTGKDIKHVFNYDYIVIPTKAITVPIILKALSKLSIGGIIILELTEVDNAFEAKYISMFSNFTATKVFYEERVYMIIHAGIDYGN